jgi:serine peptidase DegS
MQKFSLSTRYVLGPMLLGLLAALCIAYFYPQYFSLPDLKQFKAKNTRYGGYVSYSEAVNRAAPSVVNIYTMREQQINGNRSQVLPSTGSGVIVSEQGYIITNLHVVQWARDIRVALQDGREATPQIVGFSKEDDMAVLKIDLDNLQPIAIGDPDTAKVGDVVLAIGNPFGVGQTVTQGIISATRRKGLNIALFENFIQTDAAINPGNSGGALVDIDGRLLGINIGDLRQTYYGDASGIGFAIPADRAVQAMTDIVEYGRVVRGWLGATALDINPRIAQRLNLSTREGVLITDIYENSPADIAGLLPGDVLTEINGASATSMSTAIQEFANLRPGDILKIHVLRGEKDLELEAVLSIAPETQ